MMNLVYDPSGNIVVQVANIQAVPQISGQPVAQIVGPGDSATFSVVVSDSSGVTFQWKFNGNDIPGATTESLLLTNVSTTNEGQYSAVATNSAGSVTSVSAKLLLDSNGDGLPDSWEIANFGNLTSQRSAGDPDQDGVSNLDEFVDGTNPSSNTSFRPRLIAYSDAGGSVSVAPMKLSYDLGETITVTAAPFAPSVFVGWMGDLNGTVNPASLTMNGQKMVRARFASSVPIPPGIVAFWRGETDASDLIGGYGGTFYAGTSTTTPSVTISGKVGGAFTFNGTVHVRVPDSAALKPTQMTAEVWVFPTAPTGYNTVIARGSSTNTDDTWYLGVTSGTPQFYSHGSTLLEAPSAIPMNQWTHLAMSFDGSIKRLYVNGAQVAWQGGLGAFVYDTAPLPVTIGADWTSNAPSDFFNGLIDEVSLYNRALTGNEIADIYNADSLGKNVMQPYFSSPAQLPNGFIKTGYTQQIMTILGTAPVGFSLSESALPPGMTLSATGVVSGTTDLAAFFDFTVLATDAAGLSNEQLCLLQIIDNTTPAGLVGWWKAEGNALDSAGTNHGALSNGAGFSPGEVGQAFLLDGIAACVEIPDAPILRPTSLTLEAWVAFDVTSGLQVIFAKPVGSGTSDSYILWLASGLINGAVGTAASTIQINAAFTPEPQSWYHVAYTFDQNAQQHSLYVDGIQVAIDNTGAITIGYDAQPLLLGRDTENGVPSYFLKGRIYEASIYDRALSGAEIASIYNDGSAGKQL
jgi:hypothetical protein